jgi:hypothetical protein
LLVLLVSSIVTTTTTAAAARRGWAIATPTIVTTTSTIGVWWIGRMTTVASAASRRGAMSVGVRGRRGRAVVGIGRTTRVAIVRRWTTVEKGKERG